MVSEPRYLVDSGPLVGLLSKSDQWHSWSHQALTLIEEPVMTTETVLAEVCHLVGPYRATMLQVTAMLESGRLRARPVLSGQPARCGELLAKYPGMDAADATLVVLSEQFPRARLITLDSDFRHYRRFRDGVIPLLSPR